MDKQPRSTPKLKLAALMIAAVLSQPAIGDDDYPTAKLGGRLQLDYTWFDNDRIERDNGGEVRRARLNVKGKLASRWDYKLQVELSGDDPELRDGYIRYALDDQSKLWLGNYRQPGGLETMTSSNHITFTERSLLSTGSEGRRMGVGYQRYDDQSTWFVSLFGDEANQDAEGSGVIGRYVWQPRNSDGNVLHLGANAAWATNDSDTIRLRARPASHQSGERIIDTGTIADIDDFRRYGVEFAYMRDRFSVQAESQWIEADRKTGADIDFAGHYVYASYFLTDDHRGYKGDKGAFDRVRPSSPSGAWELGLRFTHLDLNSADIAGGEVDAITFAVNYYATSHLRFMLDFVTADGETPNGPDDPASVQLRAQYDF